jgi:RNA polymerase-binding transcription factor DksA
MQTIDVTRSAPPAPTTAGAALAVASHHGETLPPAVFDPVVHLLARQSELRAQLEVHTHALELGEPHLSSHLAEEAQEHQQRQSIAAVRDILSFELQQVERALARAAQGAYGICEDCAQPIALRRLQVLPAVTLCVGCQQRHEARSRWQ